MEGIIFGFICAGLLFLYGMCYTFTQTIEFVDDVNEKKSWKMYGIKLGFFCFLCFVIAILLML